MALAGLILAPVPGFLALGVMGRALPRKGKKNSKRMVGQFADIMVGTSLIPTVSAQINIL